MGRVRDAVRRLWREPGKPFFLRQCCRSAIGPGRISRLTGPLAVMTVIPVVLGLFLPGFARAAEERSLQVGPENRTYLLVAPDDAPGPRPVLIALHGAWQTSESFRAYAGFDAAAKGNGFVVVYPQGEGRVWNDGRPAAMRLKAMLRPGDDEAFLVTLARKLVEDGIADPARIYLAGISNGGFMVEKMACQQAQLFAAYVAIMATAPANYREECHPARPVPILFIHGTADSVIAYDGFWTPVGATLSAPDSARLYAALDGCGTSERRKLPDLDPSDGTTVREQRWSGCRDGVEVALMSVELGGHQSPARVDTKPDLATPFLGLRSRDIDAGEEIWRFVSAYTLAPAGAEPAGAVPGVAPARAGPAAARTGATPAVSAASAPASPRSTVPLPRPSPLRAARVQGAERPQDGANVGRANVGGAGVPLPPPAAPSLIWGAPVSGAAPASVTPE